MTRHLFPCGIRFRQDRRVELFPAAELLITGRRNRGIRATFHLDSGATVTVVPASNAHALGIPLHHGKKVV
jgi:aspartyl protease